MTQNISLEEFLKAPAEVVRLIVPPTVIFAAGGTRRAAALSGVDPENYAEWTVPRMLETCERFFYYGVQHLITPVTHPRMFQEEGYYGENFITWMEHFLGGETTLNFYNDMNWRVRLIIASTQNKDPRIHRLRQLEKKITSATKSASGPYLWYFVVPDYDDYWRWIIENIQGMDRDANTIKAIEMLFQEDIPPCDLLISFGKPTIGLDILPPFLWSLIQAYWTQKPSYLLNDEVLRRIFYDYAFLRNTYRQDKTGREENALDHPAFWLEGPTIGLGIKVGPYWYPEQSSLPSDNFK